MRCLPLLGKGMGSCSSRNELERGGQQLLCLGLRQHKRLLRQLHRQEVQLDGGFTLYPLAVVGKDLPCRACPLGLSAGFSGVAQVDDGLEVELLDKGVVEGRQGTQAVDAVLTRKLSGG